MEKTRELPLNAFWESLGGTLRAEKGWRIPSIFKDFHSEYQAVRKNIGLIDHSFRGKIKVTGNDRVGFLNHILTNDMENVISGNGCGAALLDAGGKILMDMNIYVFANEILLTTEMGYDRHTVELLEKYVIREDVQITNVTEDFALLSLQGPRSELMIRALFPGSFPELAEYQHANFLIQKTLVTVCRQSRTGELGYHMLIPAKEASKVIERVLLVGKLYGILPVGFSAKEILRIEAGVLRYGIDMDSGTILSEAGLDSEYVNEKKGCYPGQEVVARIKTYGGLNRKITGLVFNKGRLPMPHDKILDAASEKEIGHVTSACVSPLLQKGIALGYVPKSHFEKNLDVSIQTANGIIPAKTKNLPFVQKKI